MLTCFTLAVGVITWVASPIKFQADMGLLLAFMFLWNMLGALVLIPSLGYFMLNTKSKSSIDVAAGIVPPSTATEQERKGSEFCNVMVP
jgi:hypothetical protein